MENRRGSALLAMYCLRNRLEFSGEPRCHGGCRPKVVHVGGDGLPGCGGQVHVRQRHDPHLAGAYLSGPERNLASR